MRRQLYIFHLLAITQILDYSCFYMKMIAISLFIFWLTCQTNIWSINWSKTVRLFFVSVPSICLLKKNICCLFVEKDKKLFSYFVPRLFLLLLHSLVRISVPCLAFLSNQSHCPELVNLSYFFIKPITHPMANQSTNSFSNQPISHHHHDCCCFCLKKWKSILISIF